LWVAGKIAISRVDCCCSRNVCVILLFLVLSSGLICAICIPSAVERSLLCHLHSALELSREKSSIRAIIFPCMIVPTSSLPSSSRKSHVDTVNQEEKSVHVDLLTLFLRRDMAVFCASPQAKLVYLVTGAFWPSTSPSFQLSFSPAHINGLDFNEGDLVCGMYTVVLGTPTKCEFELQNPRERNPGNPKVNGRMVISYETVGMNKTLFASEMVMWRRADDKQTVMPLERIVPHWMHMVTQTYLLDSGVRYISHELT
jgi:hypothetical protein